MVRLGAQSTPVKCPPLLSAKYLITWHKHVISYPSQSKSYSKNESLSVTLLSQPVIFYKHSLFFFILDAYNFSRNSKNGSLARLVILSPTQRLLRRGWRVISQSSVLRYLKKIRRRFWIVLFLTRNICISFVKKNLHKLSQKTMIQAAFTIFDVIQRYTIMTSPR